MEDNVLDNSEEGFPNIIGIPLQSSISNGVIKSLKVLSAPTGTRSKGSPNAENSIPDKVFVTTPSPESREKFRLAEDSKGVDIIWSQSHPLSCVVSIVPLSVKSNVAKKHPVFLTIQSWVYVIGVDDKVYSSKVVVTAGRSPLSEKTG